MYVYIYNSICRTSDHYLIPGMITLPFLKILRKKTWVQRSNGSDRNDVGDGQLGAVDSPRQ